MNDMKRYAKKKNVAIKYDNILMYFLFYRFFQNYLNLLDEKHSPLYSHFLEVL